MWPWEHVAFAYVLTSAYLHRRWHAAPGEYAALVAVFASQLPDLVDKPLAWVFGVLPAGRSLAHSLLVAVPLVALAFALASLGRRRTSDRLAVAFAVGYLSHLLGDVLYPLVTDGDLRVGFLLWPIVSVHGGGSTSLFAHLSELVARFAAFLATPLGVFYLAADLLLLGGALALWIHDGTPGLAPIRDAITPPARDTPNQP